MIRRFLTTDTAATSVEYAVILALIITTAMAAIYGLGGGMTMTIEHIYTVLTLRAFDPPPGGGTP